MLIQLGSPEPYPACVYRSLRATPTDNDAVVQWVQLFVTVKPRTIPRFLAQPWHVTSRRWQATLVTLTGYHTTTSCRFSPLSISKNYNTLMLVTPSPEPYISAIQIRGNRAARDPIMMSFWGSWRHWRNKMAGNMKLLFKIILFT